MSSEEKRPSVGRVSQLIQTQYDHQDHTSMLLGKASSILQRLHPEEERPLKNAASGGSPSRDPENIIERMECLNERQSNMNFRLESILEQLDDLI